MSEERRSGGEYVRVRERVKEGDKRKREMDGIIDF
jgi:hypothetical protein